MRINIDNNKIVEFFNTETEEEFSINPDNIKKIGLLIGRGIKNIEYYVGDCPFYQYDATTLDQALELLKNGSLKVNPFGETVVIDTKHGNQTHYVYDKLSQELHKIGTPVGDKLLNLTGANYLEFNGNAGIFNFNKPWFIGISFLKTNYNNQFQTLFSLGGNSFNFLAGLGNYGIYLDDEMPPTQGGSSRASTWVQPEYENIMINYNPNTNELEYWIGSQESTPVLKKTLNVLQYNDEAKIKEDYALDVPLYIGKGAGNTSYNLKAQINDIIAGDETLGSETIKDMFRLSREDMVTHDKIKHHIPIGSSTFPAENDIKGDLNATIVGGSSSDVEPVSEE